MFRRITVACVVACGVLFCVVGSAMGSYGFQPGTEGFSFTATEAPAAGVPAGQYGQADARAGSHPFALTTSFLFKTKTGLRGTQIPDEDLKDFRTELPPGLIGNATAIPQCSIREFQESRQGVRLPESSYQFFASSNCQADTQVGVAALILLDSGFQEEYLWLPVYNLVPPPGAPAEFGFSALGIPVIFRPTVRTGGDYGLNVEARDLNQFEAVEGSIVTFWGVPGDPRHDALRGGCLAAYGESASGEKDAYQGVFPESIEQYEHQCATGAPQKAFLTLPTECSGAPLVARAQSDSWENPGSWETAGNDPLVTSSAVDESSVPVLSDPSWVSTEYSMPALTGCDRPAFSPSITVGPDTTVSDTPAGLTADVKTTQEGLVAGEGIAPADIKNTTVTLPAGMTINPGQAAGLQACQASEDGLGTELLPSCPAGSKVGIDEIETPLLHDTLKGSVYVLQSNPPNLRLLIAASADGVNVKLVAAVHLDETTGRLTTTLTETPPLPFTDFKLSFSGGAQAALVTPPTCGVYATTADFTPWSTPFGTDFPTSSSFLINTGPDGTGGSGCTGPLPFNPTLNAGATTDQAGGYTNFSLLLSRPDGQQRIKGLQFKAPPGLLGMISKVPLCPEPQANEGTCPASSQIGHTIVTAGPGPYPLVVPGPGQSPAPIYLTGAHDGAPYGLSIAVPVIAGPFNLGTSVVRATIQVDPHTAQLTITTDPSGPYAIPTVLDGIPPDLRVINAVIERPEFMFNPTNCTQTSFSGTATSNEGSSAPISTRFQVGSCHSLLFKPTLKVTANAKTSRKSGAAVSFKLTYPTPPAKSTQSTLQANIAAAKFSLPKQLPSRLSTLQKACPAATFNANPASCQSSSIVGAVRVNTPVLPVPLTGPAYFVSYGGEAFPNLVMVLQGYGVTIDVVATTFIDEKTGIISATLKTVPDAPFSKFELTLPQGPYSALAAPSNLCTAKNLTVPNTFTAQNGLVIKQNTKIALSGCTKSKKTKRVSKRGKRHEQHGRATRAGG